MDKEFFEKYIKLVNEKYDFCAKNYPDGIKPQSYLDGVVDETKEVKNEIKEKNSVYLEDELGDIVWNFFNALVILEKEGRIQSWENVFEKSYKKFSERTQCIIENGDRDTIKQKQKDELKIQHQKLYGEN